MEQREHHTLADLEQILGKGVYHRYKELEGIYKNAFEVVLNSEDDEHLRAFQAKIAKKAQELRANHPDWSNCILFHMMIGSSSPSSRSQGLFFDFPDGVVEKFIREELGKEEK